MSVSRGQVAGSMRKTIENLPEAIEALRDRIVELEEMGRAWQESDEHKHADELRAGIEAAWREVDLARAERDAHADGEDRGRPRAAARGEAARALLHLNDLLVAAEAERDAMRAEVERLWVIRDDAKSSQERMRLELVRLDTLARERGEEVERLQDLASDAGTRCGIESLKGKP